jgi:hypothetical protein
MGIKKRMWKTAFAGTSRICRGPLKEVIHIESRDTKRGGIRWTLDLECGHMACRYATNPLHKGIKPIAFAPKKVRCIVCGLAQKA